MPLRKSRSRKKIIKKSRSKRIRRSKSVRRKPKRNSRSKRRVLKRSKSRRKSLKKKSKQKNVRKSRSRRKPLRRSKSRRRSNLKYHVRSPRRQSPRRGFKPRVSIGGAYLEPILSCIPRYGSHSALASSLLAKGGEGFVFNHPTDSDKVLKVSYFAKSVSLLGSNEPPKNSSIQTANMLIERYKLYGGYKDEIVTKTRNEICYKMTSSKRNRKIFVPLYKVIVQENKLILIMKKCIPVTDFSSLNEAQFNQIAPLIEKIFNMAGIKAENFDIKYENLLDDDGKIVFGDVCCALGTMSFLPSGDELFSMDYSNWRCYMLWTIALCQLEAVLHPKAGWHYYLSYEYKKKLVDNIQKAIYPPFANIICALSLAKHLGVKFKNLSSEEDQILSSNKYIDENIVHIFLANNQHIISWVIEKLNITFNKLYDCLIKKQHSFRMNGGGGWEHRPGDTVSAKWDGVWYPAVIKSIDRKWVLVMWRGDAKDYPDEWVSVSNVRRGGGGGGCRGVDSKRYLVSRDDSTENRLFKLSGLMQQYKNELHAALSHVPSDSCYECLCIGYSVPPYDAQIGLTETAKVDEFHLDTALRGIREETGGYIDKANLRLILLGGTSSICTTYIADIATWESGQSVESEKIGQLKSILNGVESNWKRSVVGATVGQSDNFENARELILKMNALDKKIHVRKDKKKAKVFVLIYGTPNNIKEQIIKMAKAMVGNSEKIGYFTSLSKEQIDKILR